MQARKSGGFCGSESQDPCVGFKSEMQEGAMEGNADVKDERRDRRELPSERRDTAAVCESF